MPALSTQAAGHGSPDMPPDIAIPHCTRAECTPVGLCWDTCAVGRTRRTLEYRAYAGHLLVRRKARPGSGLHGFLPGGSGPSPWGSENFQELEKSVWTI